MQESLREIDRPTMDLPSLNRTFGNRIAAGIDFLSEMMGSFSGYLMLIASIIVCLEVILRSAFKAPTIWIYDISCYILVWFGFCAASYGIKEGSHINVDLLVIHMKPRTKVPFDIVSFFLCLIYSIILFVYSSKMCLLHFQGGETTPTILALPMYLVKLGMVIGTFFMVLQITLELIRKIALMAKGNLEGGESFVNKTSLMLPLYIILIVIGVWLYLAYPAAGTVMLLFVLLGGGVPVYASLGIIGTLGLYVLLGPGSGFMQVAGIGASSMQNFVILALPMYILAGEILMKGGIGQELFEVANKWVGHLPGGLALATVASCAVFAAISGSSVATAAAIGIIALPEMLKHGYDKRLAYGVVAAGGTLGIMIPPSGPMIIFASITDESTGALFIGGVIPGIILALLFGTYAAVTCYVTGKYDKIPPFPWQERFAVFKTSIWAILAPGLVIGSIYTGICTPTEAAALVVVYALVVSFLRGTIKARELNKVMAHSTRSSTMILMIIVGALVLGAITTLLQLSQQFIDFVMSFHLANWVVMFWLTVLYIILGMFLEVASILLITTPIIYPLVTQMGYNGVWFGVCVVALMEMALITPPVGLNIYVIQGIAKASMKDVAIGLFPFMILLLVGLLIMWFFPQTVLFLPGTQGLGGLR